MLSGAYKNKIQMKKGMKVGIHILLNLTTYEQCVKDTVVLRIGHNVTD